MEYVISAVWGVLDLIFIIYFCSAFLPARQSKRSFIIAILSSGLISCVYSLLGFSGPLATALSFSFVFLFIFWIYRGTWYQTLLLVILSYAVGSFFPIICCYSACAITNLSFSDLIWKKMLYVTITSVGKFVSLLFVWIYKQSRKPSQFSSVRRKLLLLSSLFSVISLAMIYAIFFFSKDFSDLSIQATIFIGIIVVGDIAILYLISVMEKNTLETQKLSLLHQQMEIQAKSIQALESSYKSQRQMTHDFKNQLQTISMLLSSNQHTEAAKYVGQLQCSHNDRVFAVNSNHAIIDAVLNMKYHAAEENQIELQFNINDLSCITIDADTLVVLLSNLLDNALEACCRIPEHRMIYCDILVSEQLYIAVRNTALPVVIQNSHIATTKEPRQEHGFGLLQIQYLLNQLGGEYYMDYQEGWFSFVTEIPI